MGTGVVAVQENWLDVIINSMCTTVVIGRSMQSMQFIACRPITGDSGKLGSGQGNRCVSSIVPRCTTHLFSSRWLPIARRTRILIRPSQEEECVQRFSFAILMQQQRGRYPFDSISIIYCPLRIPFSPSRRSFVPCCATTTTPSDISPPPNNNVKINK